MNEHEEAKKLEEERKAADTEAHTIVEKILGNGATTAYDVTAGLFDARWKACSSIAMACARITGAYLAMTDDSIKQDTHCRSNHSVMMLAKVTKLILEAMHDTETELKKARANKPHG